MEYVIVASIWFLSAGAIIGSFSNQKTLLTERRRNSLVTLSVILIAYQVAPPGVDMKLLIPGITTGEEQYIRAILALSLVLMTLTYLFYLFKEGLRSVRWLGESSSTNSPTFFDTAGIILVGPISFLKDLVIPVFVVIAGVQPLADEAGKVADKIASFIFIQLSTFNSPMGPETSRDAEQLGEYISNAFSSGIEKAMWPIFALLQAIST